MGSLSVPPKAGPLSRPQDPPPIHCALPGPAGPRGEPLLHLGSLPVSRDKSVASTFSVGDGSLRAVPGGCRCEVGGA